MVASSDSGSIEHLHPAAADQAVVPAVVVIELKRGDFGRPSCKIGQRLALDFGLDAAAAERAGLRAVGEDEHRGAGLLRRRAARFHQPATSDATPALDGGKELIEKLAAYLRYLRW